ncbi:MAG: Phosphomannomutase/phosphoglucomutase [Eubacteriales bacterium SKADARSKE-1]|nr:Phosphomannomutase/phosphoglucomutase [Eubacteriales bacterium SKADARSKE-1]
MISNYWNQFKSGTDIRGVALPGVNGENVNLTDEVVEKIAAGFGFWLTQLLNKSYKEITVAIGHDSRLSANKIKNIIIGTLAGMGIKIYDCSLSSTPAMFMTTIDLNCDAAIEITASHHPFNRNGLKFFTKDGGLNGTDIEKILQYAENGVAIEKVSTKQVETVDFMKIYSKRLREVICKEINTDDYLHPLKGFKILVDAGNGAGGFYATDVLLPLGADITGSQFLEPDGNFKNHIPNPENKEAMDCTRKATLKNKADLGIVFDTDVDRAGVVDSSGHEINRNKLIALAATIALENNKGGTIVTDSVTSNGVKKYIEDLNGVHKRFKRGYKNVINEAIRLNQLRINCPLAIETSGHAAMRENYFLDDGAYLVTKIIIMMVKLKNRGKQIADIILKLNEPKESFEYRLKINCGEFKSYGDKIIEKAHEFVKTQPGWKVATDSYEGIRVAVTEPSGEGWFLLRVSIHDPVMVMNAESDTENGVSEMLKKLQPFFEEFKQLETKF